MKKNFLVVALAAAVAGCTAFHDEMPLAAGEAEKGSLDVEFMDGGQFTKGDVPLESSVINDVNIYIFDEQGKIVTGGFFTGSDVQLQDVMIYMRSRYSVYAIANWGKELAVQSPDELEGLSCKADDVASIAGSQVGAVMCGKLENVTLSLKETLQLPLQRVLGKVQVVCDFSRLWKSVSLTVKEVSIKNVPVETFLFKDNVASAVADGKVYGSEELSGISGSGVEFHLFENLQGQVDGASDNKSKASLLDAGRRALGTYIEMKCYLVSNAHRGDIIYRFYLGTAHTDCNVFRNASQKMTVYFIGDVSQEEYSVSVDNSALLDRVTSIIVQPAVVYFSPGLGKTLQCRAQPQPATAFDKRITWESTNTRVAVVSQTGLITTTGPGECRVIARSVENPDETGSLKVRVLE